MFYRQKILLALIELCGGRLSNTDLEKLLFLFCQYTHRNYYDFFPYKYGAFSFMTYHDKSKLMEKGLLKNVSHFELEASKSYVSKLQTKDQIALNNFVFTVGHLRGKELIRKAYLDYPQYAIKSEIANNLLSLKELGEIYSCSNINTESALFTIGYEGNSIDQYLYRLLSNNVSALIDVRKNPFSRKHGFSRKVLQTYATKAGIQYYHLPELGISSNLRKNLNGDESYKKLFEHYAVNILPKQDQAIDEIRNLLSKHKRVALTCFEAEYQMCHRHKIVELLEQDHTLEADIHHI